MRKLYWTVGPRSLYASETLWWRRKRTAGEFCCVVLLSVRRRLLTQASEAHAWWLKGTLRYATMNGIHGAFLCYARTSFRRWCVEPDRGGVRTSRSWSLLLKVQTSTLEDMHNFTTLCFSLQAELNTPGLRSVSIVSAEQKTCYNALCRPAGDTSGLAKPPS